MAAASNEMGERRNVLNVKVVNNEIESLMFHVRQHTLQEVN